MPLSWSASSKLSSVCLVLFLDRGYKGNNIIDILIGNGCLICYLQNQLLSSGKHSVIPSINMTGPVLSELHAVV